MPDTDEERTVRSLALNGWGAFALFFLMATIGSLLTVVFGEITLIVMIWTLVGLCLMAAVTGGEHGQ